MAAAYFAFPIQLQQCQIFFCTIGALYVGNDCHILAFWDYERLQEKQMPLRSKQHLRVSLLSSKFIDHITPRSRLSVDFVIYTHTMMYLLSLFVYVILVHYVQGSPVLIQPNGTLPTSPAFQSAVSAALAAANLSPYIPPPAGRTITNWLAIGDSYSAGVGADMLGDYDSYSQDCPRFTKAMPRAIQNSSSMPGDQNSRVLTFGSCTGATMQNIIDKQLSQGEPTHYEYTPNGKPQLATLSAGGNDLGFGEYVVSLIYMNVCLQLL